MSGHHALAALLAAAALAQGSPVAAAAEPGRLFYTPAQRVQLEAARHRGNRPPAGPEDDAESPLRYDGVLIRSDGRVTRWVDGKPAAAVPAGLQPGQTRVDGKVFEPYQLLAPTRAAPAEDTAP